MRNFLAIIMIILLITNCGKDPKGDQAAGPQSPTTLDEQRFPADTPDPNAKKTVEDLKPNPNVPNEPVLLKGVNMTNPISATMVRKGQEVYNGKCVSCHSLDGSASTASSFAGITQRRRPEWIMNVTTGVELKAFIDNRRERNQINQCYTRQPGQRLNIMQSRDILEFFRQNDGEK